MGDFLEVFKKSLEEGSTGSLENASTSGYSASEKDKFPANAKKQPKGTFLDVFASSLKEDEARRLQAETAANAQKNLAGRSEFTRGLLRGVDTLQATYEGGLGMYNAFMGDQEAASQRFANYQEQMRQASENPGTVTDFFSTDEKTGAFASPGNFGTYVAGTLGQAVPSLTEAVVSGIAGAAVGAAIVPAPDPADVVTIPAGAIGGFLGRNAMKRAIASAAQQYASRGMAQDVAEQTAERYVRQAVANRIASNAGSSLAVSQTTALHEGGGMWAEGMEQGYNSPGTSIALGQVSGFSEALFGAAPTAVRAILGKAAVNEAAKDLGWKQAAGYAWDVIKNSGEEGVQEAFQEYLGAVNQSINDPKFKLYTKENFMQWAEAAAAGAVTGGVVGGGGAGLQAIRDRKRQLEQIKAKNFVSESDAQEAGIEGTSRRERMANVDAEIEQLTASESEAVAQSDREFISQQQGGQAPPMQGDVALSAQQVGGVQIDENGRIVLSDEDAELDRQFFEEQEKARTASQGGNVATPVATGTETAPPVAPQPTVQPPQVPPAAPVVEPPQAPPVAQQPQPLYEVAGDENMVARVWPNPKGFLVNLTDMDSGEVDTRAMIFPTFEQAKQHADTVRLPSQQPQAQPVVTPEDPFAEQQQQVPQQTPALTREQQAESDRQYAQSQQMPSQGQIAPATVDPFSADENQQAGQVGRELWQKRLDEVDAERSSPNDYSPITKWESAVRQAIAEGKDVPSDVLNDFQEWDALLSDDLEEKIVLRSSSDARSITPDKQVDSKKQEPWQMSRAEAQAQGWGENWSSVVRRGIDQGKDVPASVRDELFAYDKERESKSPKREEMPKAKIGDTVVRYTHKDGSGLLNNNELDLLRLTDEEESELVELMDFGLQQPGSGTSGVFYFTKEGEQKHKRMIDLLSKASKKGVVRSETVLDQEPSWESEDGQIAVVQKQGRKKEVKPEQSESPASDIDAAMEEEFKRQLAQKSNDQQPPPSGGKPPKKRSARKKKPPTEKPPQSSRSKEERKKEIGDLWNQLINESKNRLPSGLDPELLKIAAKLAIAVIEDGALTFAEFVKESVANIPGDMLDRLKPYIESAWRTAHRNKMTEDAGGKFDDYMKKPQQPKQEQPEAEKESDVDKTLRQAGLKVEKLADGTWQITGNTYEHSKEIGDVKREVRELGGYWDKYGKRWTFKADPRRAIADRLVGKGVGEEPSDAGVSDEQMARERARREEDAKADVQTTSESYVASVDQSTRDLIGRGIKFGMTEEVVSNQIEDIGRVIDAAENGRPMFVIGSAPGTGKTFVLGGVIRELRRRGFKKFVYVTQNQDLVSQVQTNLADYGLEGVEFITYTKARTEPPSTNGAVLLLDEAHTAKNLGRETGKKLSSMVQSSRFTVYATATPFENVTEAEYIGYSGIFDDLQVQFDKPSSKPGGRPFRNELYGFNAWAWMFGANVYFVKQEGRNGETRFVPVVWWDKQQTSEEDQLAANEWLKKRGVYVQRPMALPVGMVNSELRSIEADPYWADISNQVVDIYANAESESESNIERGQIKAHKANVLKRLLEASKVDAAIARAKELIGKGETNDPQVIIFVNTKADTDIGTYTLSEPYRKEYGIKGKDAKRRYEPSEMDEMMQRWYEAKAIAKQTGDDAGPPPFAPFVHKIAMAMEDAGVMEKFPSVIDKIMEAFPGQAVEYSGRTASQNSSNLAKWKNNEAKLIVATMDKGGTGLSFHDTTGKMPSRYQVNMNLPWSGTKVEQVSGRLARYGTAKPVNIEWIFANNIPFDRELSKTVGSRMRSMAAAVQGRKSGEAKQIRDFDFEESPVVAKTLPKPIADRLLSLPVEQRTSPFGDRNATLRQDVIEAITGTRPPKSKAGMNAVRDALATFFGIDKNEVSGAALDEAIIAGLERSAVATNDTVSLKLPWADATVEDEGRWAGTLVNVSAKGKEEGYAGKVVRVLNKGETIEVQRDGFDVAVRVPAERVSIVDIVDNKFVSSAEQADKAAKILADMESNQEKMRQDKKQREGEKLANWVKAFEGNPREVTAAKDLFRKDFEKARENGVSDDRLMEIIDHGQANEMFTEKEAADLKGRIMPAAQQDAASQMHYPDGSAYRKWVSRRHRLGDHPTSYLSGHSSAKVREAAKQNPGLGLVITPANPSYVDHAGDYSHIMVDNGAFSEFTGKAPFSEDKFFALLDRIVAAGLKDKVQFVVVPDRVGDWAGTNKRWDEFKERVKSYGMPLAYVGQDGIEQHLDKIPWDEFDVFFIGGSTPWKVGYNPKGDYKDFNRPTDDELRKAGDSREYVNLIKEVKRRGKKIHMGRVNSFRRIEIANYGMQVDSADGNYIGAAPDKNLPVVLDWLNATGGGVFKQKHELLLDRAAKYREKGQSYKRDIADPAMRLQMAIANGNPIDGTLVRSLADELEIRLDYWEPILQKAEESEQDQQDDVNTNQEEGLSDEEQAQVDSGSKEGDGRTPKDQAGKGRIVGSKTKVGKRAAHYEVVELSSLTGSHHPFGMGVNEDFPAEWQQFQRSYHTYSEAQKQEVWMPKEGFDISQVIDATRFHDRGPTMAIERNGKLYVVGGTRRYMMLANLYRSFPDKALDYHNALVAEAEMFGLDASSVNGMDTPILIRVIDEPGENIAKLVDELNSDAGFQKDPAAEAASLGRSVGKNTIKVLRGINDEETLSKFLDRKGVDVVYAMINDNPELKTKTPGWIKDNSLTKDAKLAVQKAIMGAVISDATLIGQASPRLLQSVNGALAEILMLNQKGGEWGLSERIKEAITYDAEFRLTGRASSDRNIENWMNDPQQSFLEEFKKDPKSDGYRLWRYLLEYGGARKFRIALQNTMMKEARLDVGDGGLFADLEESMSGNEAFELLLGNRSPDVKPQGDAEGQLTDNLKNPPDVLYQEEPNVYASLRSQALDLGISANRAGITQFEDFVVYSIDNVGEKQTRFMEALLKLSARMVGMEGIRDVDSILGGSNLTRDQYVQLAKETFASVPAEQVEAGIEAAMLTGLPQMAVGFSPAGSPVPRQSLLQSRSRLSVLHNLSADNLVFADRMGGLAVPSLAVVKEDMGLDGYGEITLIGRGDLVNPELVEVRDADAYTSRFPEPEYKKAKRSVVQKLIDQIRPLSEAFSARSIIDSLWDNAINKPNPSKSVYEAINSNPMKAWFLSEKGIKTQPVMSPIPPRWNWVYSPSWINFVKTANHAVGDLGTEDPAKEQYLKDAGIAAVAAMREAAESYRKAGFEQNRIDGIVEDGRKAFLDEDGRLFYSYLYSAMASAEKMGKMQVDTAETTAKLNKLLEGIEQEFKSWVESKILPMYGKPFLRDGRKLVDYNLDNIVKKMTTGGTTAKEKTMSFGEGMARAAASSRISSLEEMRNRSGSISRKEDIEAGRELAKKSLYSWRDSVIGYYKYNDTWDALDASMRAIAKWAKGRDLASALRSEGFVGVPKNIVVDGIEAGRLFMNAPVPYFEAKPHRIVQLGEFAGAVIPEDASKQVLEILEKNGIPFRAYSTKEAENQRESVVTGFRNELDANGGNVLFQNQAENPRIGMSYKDANKRVPALTEAAKMLKEGSITKDEYADIVDRSKTVTPYDFVPEPATYEDAKRALPEGRIDKFGKTSTEIPSGYKVKLRLDIPSFTRAGVWVNTIHRTVNGKAETEYDAYSSVTDANFNQTPGEQRSAFSVATGEKPKGPFATIHGKWQQMTKEEAVAKAKAALKSDEWIQVGYDPERHSYFYDRSDTRKVLSSADEVIQIGPLVLAKNPVYGSRSDVLFQGQNEAPRWYLKSRKLIQEKMGQKASAEQVLGMLRKNGVNDEELYWSGLEELLGSKQSMTKDEVLAAIDSGFMVTESQLPSDPVDAVEARQRLEAEGITLERGMDGDYAWENEDGVMEDEDIEELSEDLQYDMDVVMASNEESSTGKYAQYTTPGGENYRELLIKIPYATKTERAGGAEYRVAQNIHGDKKFHVVRNSEWEDQGYDTREEAQAAIDAIPEVKSIDIDKIYMSSHWDEANVVAHVRMNERVDMSGNKVLLIEEIQSDWHQEGRTKGYSGRIFTPFNLKDKSEGPEFRTEAEARDWVASLSSKMRNLYDVRSKPGVPEAPFKKSWPMLAMKRAIQYAIDIGADKVAWVKGQRQADRYDLSKQVESITVGKFEGTYWFRAVPLGEKGTDSDIEKKGLSANELAESIGKELAEKAMRDIGDKDGQRSYYDSDLKVGGEGMKAFYDNILVNETNKLIKKFGAKVGTTSTPLAPGMGFYKGEDFAVEKDEDTGTYSIYDTEVDRPVLENLSTYEDAVYAMSGMYVLVDSEGNNIGEGPWFSAEDAKEFMEAEVGDDSVQVKQVGGGGTAEHHSFDITPAMRDSVLQNGQPLFQQQVPSGNVKGWTKFITGTRALIGATNKADISTVIHEFAHPIRRFLLDRNIPQDQRVGITDEEIEMLEKKCGAGSMVDGEWVTKWDVAAEEKLARMWEQYWFVGESPNKVLDSLFAKISRWMREVYNSITQITGSPLDPKVVELFDKLVQRGLTEEQRGYGRKSTGGGDSSTANPSDTNEWSERVTSIKNQVAAMIRLRVGLPGFIEPSRETFQQWLDEASQLLKADPALGDRLIKELAQSNRTISHIEVAVLQMQFQHLNNQLDAASERLFAANEAKDSVAAAQARLDSDMLINQIEDFTDITKRAGTDAGRALVARRIALLSDFSLAALLRKARVANGGEKLNKEQQRQIEALSRKIEKLEGDLEKEIQKNNDLERQAAIKQGIEDDKKQAGKPVKNTARKRASDTVKEFAKKFSSIFGGAGGTDTLQQTEDEKMAEAAVDVIKSYVASGVYSFGEFMAKVKQDLGAEVPVAAKVAFRTAWEDMKSQGDIPTPEVSEDQKSKEIGRLAKMIQYALVESGITDPEDVIDGVHESLQEVFEDITKRETMDAMSGYGQYSTPSQDPTDKIVRDLNAQYQQMAKLDDMQQGIAPKRSGRGRDEQSPELRKLIREVNEMKRNSKYFITDPELQLKTIFQATRTALRNRIYDLSNAINVAEKPLLARTGVEFKGKEAEEIAAFRKLRDELLAEYKATFPKPGMTFEQRAALVERALERQILEVEKQLASGNVAPKPSATPISTPSIDAKRARLDALRAQREAVREMQKPKLTDEEIKDREKLRAEKAYIANLLNRIADYEDRRRQGYFGPKPKKKPRDLSPREIELSRQLENVKDEFFRYSAEYRLKNMTPAQRGWDYAKETMHLSRAIMTSFDLSAVFRQGGIASLAHPRLAASSSREMWNALRKEGAEFKTMSDIESDELYATAMRAGLSITTDSGKITKQEEAYMGRWAKWGIGKKGTKINTASRIALKPVTASARAYTTFLNSMRFRLFKYMVSNLGAGGEVTIDEAKIIASYVNAATGRADLGKFNQAMANLNVVFFAPRYVASRFQYLAMPFYLLPSSKVSGRVKKMIAMEYARHIMGLTAFLGLSVALGSLLTDDEEEKPTVEFDPRSSDWMKLKIGDTRIDPMAGLSQTVTLVGQLATGQKKGLKGDIQDLYGEKRKFGDPDLWDVTTGFLRKKLAPIPGAIVDLRVGENVIGEKETVLSATTDLFVPLSFQEAGETFKARGIVGGAAVTALSLLGMGGGTYGPKTQYATADAAKREELLAKELDRMKWDSPDPAFKDFLTPSQLDQFTKKREQRKQALAYAASADPKRKTHSSDEAYKQSVAEQEEAMNSLIKSGMGFEEIRQLLIAYYKRNYGSAYETRNGTYQMKESLTNRLRVIRRKMAEKKN